MKRALAGAVLAATSFYALGVYLPARGRAELDAAIRSYGGCSNVIVDYAPGYGGFGHNCFTNYAQRREQILWRYFFLETLMSHL